ncbi:hypothetical protein AKJ49_01800, partial [candidate division MSBL1 archaeon SCGC-AAA382A03]
MLFKGLNKNSLIEWPSKVVAVAYTGSCNFRCPFCQNKELVLEPEKLPDIKEKEIIKHLKKKRKWLDGLMVTGGEPTIHSNLPNVARQLKEEEFLFGIETNGSNPQMLIEMMKENLLDRVALDIKAPLVWDKYKKAIGRKNPELLQKIKESIDIIQNSDISHEFRTTVVPEILQEKDLQMIGTQIQNAEEFNLQQFVPENTLDEKYEKIEPYPEKKLEKMKKQLLEKCEI